MLARTRARILGPTLAGILARIPVRVLAPSLGPTLAQILAPTIPRILAPILAPTLVPTPAWMLAPTLARILAASLARILARILALTLSWMLAASLARIVAPSLAPMARILARYDPFAADQLRVQRPISRHLQPKRSGGAIRQPVSEPGQEQRDKIGRPLVHGVPGIRIHPVYLDLLPPRSDP